MHEKSVYPFKVFISARKLSFALKIEKTLWVYSKLSNLRVLDRGRMSKVVQC